MRKKWKTIIKSDKGLFDFGLRELWQYRDLCITFVKRNYKTRYKQTAFGPLYMIMSPLLTSGIFSIVFGLIAKVSTDGVPDFLFYMLGNLVWNCFAGMVYENNNIFLSNAYILGKVYFPRFVISISNSLTKLISICVQTIMFVLFYIAFSFYGFEMEANWLLLLVPVMFISLQFFGAGLGLIISSLTVKYRDLNVILGTVMNIWMYITPIIYPMSNLSGNWQRLAFLNPIAAPVELVRYAFFGSGIISIPAIVYSLIVSIVVFMIGIILFNQVEKDFIDTI